MGLRVRTAAALSTHPLATHAVGECVGQLLEEGGPSPDLLVLGVTDPNLGALEDIVGAIRRLLDPAVLIGASAESVLGGAKEAEHIAAVSMFALWGEAEGGGVSVIDRSAIVRMVRLASSSGPDGPGRIGVDDLRGAAGTLIVLADPFSVPVEHLIDRLRSVAPDLVVVGGLVSSARHAGGNRLVADGSIHSDGVVAALVSPEIGVRTVVSQGCRPIGVPMTVTRCERNVILELAGRPALERLMQVVDSLGPPDRLLAANGLHVGRVVDEHRSDFGRGDFLIRNVLGADRQIGAVAVGDEVELGATVQFQVRDARSADEDLAVMMAGHDVVGALVFTCNGRGTRLFGVPDHDAAVVSEALGGAPVAGLFCAGEIGPVGGTSFVHGLTASVVLFS